MKVRGILVLAFLLSALDLSAAASLDAGFEEALAQTPSRQEQLYAEGTDALDARRWEKAVQAFGEAARLDGSRADASLYWKAYAEQKLGRRGEAAAALGELRRRFPKSRWLKDAAALEVEMRRGPETAAAAEEGPDDELKLIAIGSLANSDPERALPLLERVLAGNGSSEMKERALFVLTQSPAPRARALLSDIARGRRSPELQSEAIRLLGTMGRGNGPLLSEIYASAPNDDVKEEVLEAYLISGDRAPVLAAARSEKSAEVRAKAVQLLGAMGARGELWQLYHAEPSRELKEEILSALAAAGDADHLTEAARSEKDPELRAAAIEKLGILGKRTEATLLAIYRSETDPKLREAAVDGLFVQGNAHALVELARAEKDRRMKAEIVEKLSTMQTKEATDYMLEILSK
ncbi:MAG TPA: HEAT repeat domain-containing protein [Thermoanaerobaculia bacterium]|nr:HEAT repeat domain-containing protein [Thermoanaerobaculia bacterium]